MAYQSFFPYDTWVIATTLSTMLYFFTHSVRALWTRVEIWSFSKMSYLVLNCATMDSRISLQIDGRTFSLYSNPTFETSWVISWLWLSSSLWYHLDRAGRKSSSSLSNHLWCHLDQFTHSLSLNNCSMLLLHTLHHHELGPLAILVRQKILFYSALELFSVWHLSDHHSFEHNVVFSCPLSQGIVDQAKIWSFSKMRCSALNYATTNSRISLHIDKGHPRYI